MIDNTAELGLKLPAPEVSPEEVEQLVRTLERASEEPIVSEPGKRPRKPGWFTAIELAAIMGGGVTDREVRLIASAARPVIVSFPGSPGYKLWKQCTVEEINHCIASLESQGSDMFKSANLYRQAYHRRFRGTPAASGQISL